MEETKTMHQLDLGECIYWAIGDDYRNTQMIQRVPGGWLFTTYRTESILTSSKVIEHILSQIFVPYSEEFKTQ